MTIKSGDFVEHYVFLICKLGRFFEWDSSAYTMCFCINSLLTHQVCFVASQNDKCLVHITKLSCILHPLFDAIIWLPRCYIIHNYDSLTIFDVTWDQTFALFLAGRVPEVKSYDSIFNIHFLGNKINTDGCVVVIFEVVIFEPVNYWCFAHRLVTEKNYLKRLLFACHYDLNQLLYKQFIIDIKYWQVRFSNSLFVVLI